MDEQVSLSEQTAQPDAADAAVVEEASAEFLGRWQRLVSTTNWEKGRIICQWRLRLLEAGAPPQECTDEAWSRRVGNVSPQHVGRLRRVWEQFGATHDQYAGLYWSHFQAVLDWHDAEMWLEGAVQNGWSVAQMRVNRWEATGAVAADRPREDQIVPAEPDEDFERAAAPGDADGSRLGEVRDPDGDIEPSAATEDGDFLAEATSPAEPVRPLEHLPTLPDDLREAFESFKVALLSHKLSGWREVACADVLAALEALKQLAVAPA